MKILKKFADAFAIIAGDDNEKSFIRVAWFSSVLTRNP